MSLLTVFANFRIDSQERLLRLMKSFESFQSAGINKWVINIRGEYKTLAGDFLTQKLSDNLDLFYMESSDGWFEDSKKMLPHIQSNYVLVWVEDHICMCDPDHLLVLVEEMNIHNAEYMDYTWFGDGRYLDEFADISKIDAENSYIVDYNAENHAIRNNHAITKLNQPNGMGIISLASIVSRDLFVKLITIRDPFWRRNSKYSPHDYEKNSKHASWLPLKMALPKTELFACIDDDNRHPGSSLIKRGLYPGRYAGADNPQNLLVPKFGMYKALKYIYYRFYFFKFIPERIARNYWRWILKIRTLLLQIPYQF